LQFVKQALQLKTPSI